jgi:hypothetical protein
MMDDLEKDVKSMILKVAGLPDEPGKLGDGTRLSDLGYLDIMCDDLAENLDHYVKSKKPGTKVMSGELSTGMTAGSCVKLVKNKLK